MATVEAVPAGTSEPSQNVEEPVGTAPVEATPTPAAEVAESSPQEATEAPKPAATAAAEPDKKKTLIFEPSQVSRMPDAVKHYAKRLLEQHRAPVEFEQRINNRFPVNSHALCVQVTNSYEPKGETYEVFVRNVSVTGMGIVHTRAISNGLLAIQLDLPNGKRMRMIGEVVRSQANGRFYDIGIRFVAKLDD